VVPIGLILVLIVWGISKVHKLAGAISGFIATTIILLFGLEAYSSGETMAFRTLPIPQWVFLAFIAVWYLVDMAQLAGVINERRLAKTQKAVVETGLESHISASDLLKQMADTLAQQTGAEGELAKEIVNGTSYEETMQRLCSTSQYDIAQAGVLYRTALDLIAQMQGSIQSEYQAKGQRDQITDLTHYVLPGVRAHPSLPIRAKDLLPEDVIIAYDGQLVRSLSELRRLARKTAQGSELPLSAIRWDKDLKEWTPVETTIEGGELETRQEASAVGAAAQVANPYRWFAFALGLCSILCVPIAVIAGLAATWLAVVLLVTTFLVSIAGLSIGYLAIKYARLHFGVGEPEAKIGIVMSLVGFMFSLLVIVSVSFF